VLDLPTLDSERHCRRLVITPDYHTWNLATAFTVVPWRMVASHEKEVGNESMGHVQNEVHAVIRLNKQIS